MLRLKLDLKPLVTLIRGEQFVRMQTMRGEDFSCVVFRSSLQLRSSRLLSIFETFGYFLKSRFAIDLLSSDLGIDLPRGVPFSVQYSLLDVLFVCLVLKDDNLFLFQDENRVLQLVVNCAPRAERLGYAGERGLAF